MNLFEGGLLSSKSFQNITPYKNSYKARYYLENFCLLVLLHQVAFQIDAVPIEQEHGNSTKVRN